MPACYSHGVRPLGNSDCLVKHGGTKIYPMEYCDIAMTREAKAAEATIFALLNDKQKEFITFVLSKYIETGVDELDQEKLPILLTNKYQSLEDAKEILGDVTNISRLFIEFQAHLYKQKAA